MEKPVETRDPLAGGGGFDVFQEGGEAADDFFIIEGGGDFAEAVERDAGDFRALFPGVLANFFERELLLEGKQDVPFLRREIDGGGGHHRRGDIRQVTGFENLAPDMADTKREDAVGGHEEVFGRAGEAEKGGRVEIEGFADGDFQCGPEPVAGAGDLGIRGAYDHVARKRIFLGHEVEGLIQFFLRDPPSDQGTVGELRRKQGLAHPADHSGGDHGAGALQDGSQVHTGLFRDHVEGMAVETGDQVFRNGEDGGIHGIGMLDGDGGTHVWNLGKTGGIGSPAVAGYRANHMDFSAARDFR